MRPIQRFRHLMSSTVQIAQPAGMNEYGEESYGADVSYRAHLRGEHKLVRDAGGEEVVSSKRIYLEGTANINPNSRVTLSTADVGTTESGLRQPPILAIERRFDQNGPHHVVVHLV